MSLLNDNQMPDASPRRIICHWTAGAYKASALDRKHYHFVIEDDGKIVECIHSIKDNDSTGDGKYAAHTRLCNTKAIGLSVCCMAGATKTNPGRFPMTEIQWRRMAEVAAELCKRYRIVVEPKTVLGHFEVQRILGRTQRGKWDPGFLPWDPSADEREVGDRFRNLVQEFLDGDGEPEEKAGSDIAVALEGKALSGAIDTNEEVHIPVKTLVQDLKWKVVYANETHVALDTGSKSELMYLAFSFLDESIEVDEDDEEEEIEKLVTENGYVLASDIGEETNLPVDFDDGKEILSIGQKPKAAKGGSGKAKPKLKQVVVRRGDTLAKIAAIHLSSGSRWKELMKPDGTTFTNRDARRLQVGRWS